MDVYIKNITIGDEKTNRLLAFLDFKEIQWSTKQPIPPAIEDTDKCIHCGAKAIDKDSQVFCHKCGQEFRKNEETSNDIDMNLLADLLVFSDRYEITLQFWPDWEQEYKKHIVEFAFQCSNGIKLPVSGRSEQLLFIPTDDYINGLWEERNSSGTYLEGNLCRREGAKFIRDLMLNGNWRITTKTNKQG